MSQAHEKCQKNKNTLEMWKTLVSWPFRQGKRRTCTAEFITNFESNESGFMENKRHSLTNDCGDSVRWLRVLSRSSSIWEEEDAEAWGAPPASSRIRHEAFKDAAPIWHFVLIPPGGSSSPGVQPTYREFSRTWKGTSLLGDELAGNPPGVLKDDTRTLACTLNNVWHGSGGADVTLECVGNPLSTLRGREEGWTADTDHARTDT